MPERVAKRIAEGNAFLWLTSSSQPASMASIVRESPRGATVSLVYTPPSFRGRGFASGCVAEACQTALARGKSFITLYADLDNMTSTGLYKRLGFSLVATTEEISFTAPG